MKNKNIVVAIVILLVAAIGFLIWKKQVPTISEPGEEEIIGNINIIEDGRVENVDEIESVDLEDIENEFKDIDADLEGL